MTRPNAAELIVDHMMKVQRIGSEAWLREQFPEKDWHRHPRTDGRTDLCDGTPSDCRSKVRLAGGDERG